MGKLARPLVPDGPIRRFYERLHALHAAAGEPSMRALQRATRGPRRPRGINPTTIHKAFTAPQLARWEVVREIVGQLQGDVDELEQLWRRARDAQLTGADEHPVPPAGAMPPSRTVPRELPAVVADFVGRDLQLKELDGLLGSAAETVAIAAIAGPGGVGKTTLALRWAHQVRDRFPDGQLWVDLRGYSQASTPVSPTEVLAWFLRALGVPPDEIPTEAVTAAARYRSVLAGRRVLVVLDNAASADQVRPLLPGSPGCVVLVTSRDRLAGLVARDGAHRVSVDVLDAADSRTLLSRLLGGERVAAEPAATGELARRCSYLPLALRIAAASLSHRPHHRIADHVAQLDRPGALGLLELDDDPFTGVRRTFALSYLAACEEGRRLFRLLGLVPAADVTPAAAAALADLPLTEAGRLLDRLAGAHLVYEPAPGRYTWHDLVHQYAAELAGQDEPPAARAAALTRWYEWYLHTTSTAADLLYPRRMRLPTPQPRHPSALDFPDSAAAHAWLTGEHANLVTVITSAAVSPDNRPVAWLLTCALHAYYWLGMYPVDWQRTTQAARAAAEAETDLLAQAAVLVSQGTLQARLGHRQQAIDAFTRALALAEQVGWVGGQVASQGSLGIVYRDHGELSLATDHLLRAAAVCQNHADDPELRAHAAVTVGSLATIYRLRGMLTEATVYDTRALALYRAIGAGSGEAGALNGLGETCQLQGELGQASVYLNEALSRAREVNDRGNEAEAIRGLAEVDRDAGQLDRALGQAQAALQSVVDMADSRLEAVARSTLATIHYELGEHQLAETGHRQTLHLARTNGDSYLVARALLGLAATARAQGRNEDAYGHAAQARDLAARAGFSLLEQQARTALGVPGS